MASLQERVLKAVAMYKEEYQQLLDAPLVTQDDPESEIAARKLSAATDFVDQILFAIGCKNTRLDVRVFGEDSMFTRISTEIPNDIDPR